MLEIVGLPLHTGHKRCISKMESVAGVKNFVLRCPRQWGKSHFLIDRALAWSIRAKREAPEVIWYVSPIIEQSARIFRNFLLPILERLPKDVLARRPNRSLMEVKFANGSILQFKGADKPDNLRGATLTRGIFDEYDYYKEGTRENIFEPMLSRRGIMSIYSSTPAGKRDFYNLSKRCESGEAGWLEHWGNIYETDNPILIDYVNNMKRFLPEDRFRQEYMAEFIDGGGQVFNELNNIFILDDYADAGTRHYAGVDLGQRNDRTVITILNDLGEMVYFKRFELNEQSNAEILTERIAKILRMFPRTEAFIEVNFNPAVLDMLRGRHGLGSAYKFYTTPQSKTDIVTNLQYCISSRAIKCPEINILKTELENYEMDLSPTRRNFTYNAPQGLHDDCVISLALACELFVNKNRRRIWAA